MSTLLAWTSCSSPRVRSSVRLLLLRDRIVELLGDAQLLDGHGDLCNLGLEIDHSAGLVARLIKRLASQLRDWTTEEGREREDESENGAAQVTVEWQRARQSS